MMAKRDSHTMQPAQQRKKNIMKKATITATPVAARSHFQLFLTSLVKSAKAPWFIALEN
jgi:hypothetical protein